MPYQKTGSVFLLLIAVTCLASVNGTSVANLDSNTSLKAREQKGRVAPVHYSEFKNVMHSLVRRSCERTQAPEALTTPDPLLDLTASNAKATVSFIIGTDGRVYSPLVLTSAGSEQDRTILSTVKSWRYRPATCNGVPTEMEARIEFSSH